ncbi:MAG TPA: glutamate 5-kinase [Solirubrobacterales bacterium]|nr:glutamate 5-kinase [Solirubrobacterales bacterium]
MAERYSRIAVVKTGSSVLIEEAGEVKQDALAGIVADAIRLRQAGWGLLWVVSGAVAHGKAVLRVPQVQEFSTTDLQAISAIGQGDLYQRIAAQFGESGEKTAQMLLTFTEVTDRRSYLRVQGALRRLLHWEVTPIVNENDSVTTEGVSFGNNDWLAAQVACLMQADRLVMLTGTPGVMTADPRYNEGAETLDVIDDVDRFLEGDARARYASKGSLVGKGGMEAKLRAAELAARRGIGVSIGSLQSGSLYAHVNGEAPATTVRAPVAQHSERGNFRFWLEHARQSRGWVSVDEGAVSALRRSKGASLLPVGVVDAGGEFEAGDAIEVRDSEKRAVAKGIAKFSRRELQLLANARALDPEILPEDARTEVIHRDEMILLQPDGVSSLG